MSHPIEDEYVKANLVLQAEFLQRSCTAGKMVVEFNMKDGQWKLGNVTVTSYAALYQLKHSAEGEHDPVSHTGPRRI